MNDTGENLLLDLLEWLGRALDRMTRCWTHGESPAPRASLGGGELTHFGLFSMAVSVAQSPDFRGNGDY